MPELPIRWPNGCRFAFSIVDDTDDATVANVKPVYDFFRSLGWRTTKTVWPVACPEGSRLFFAGHTMDDPDYARFVCDLAAAGFEIAFHGATMESSERGRTERALARFRDVLDVVPRLHCNHASNRENLYWGSDRYVTHPARFIARGMAGRLKQGVFQGHVPASPFFWGDLCFETFSYVRGYTFAKLPLPRPVPLGPYRNPDTPFVRNWFASSDAPDVDAFVNLVQPEAVARVARAGGVCIVSTHLGKGFSQAGVLDPRFTESLTTIGRMDGWFAPASEILDWMVTQVGVPTLSRGRMRLLESLHVLDRAWAATLRRG